jgi:phosphatidylserine/phosphatidylglycerophosphate/cardiolipin synthase-like enzyme
MPLHSPRCCVTERRRFSSSTTWSRHKPFQTDPNSEPIWRPNNGRERIAAFIDSAKETLWIQNERYQDTVIIERLVRAVNRGVRVHIMARPAHRMKSSKLVEGIGDLRIMHDVGAKIHTLMELKLHGKMLLADEKRGKSCRRAAPRASAAARRRPEPGPPRPCVN